MPHTARVALTHLRAWRTQNLLTVAELAKRAGVAQSTIIDLENGKTSANPKTIGKLAVALGIPDRSLLKAPPEETQERSQPVIDWEGEQGRVVKSLVEHFLPRLMAFDDWSDSTAIRQQLDLENIQAELSRLFGASLLPNKRYLGPVGQEEEERRMGLTHSE